MIEWKMRSSLDICRTNWICFDILPKVMARPLRIEYPGAFYHGINRGLERREIYRGKKDYEAFLSLCLEIHRRFKFVIHACALMPNHYHLMVETPEGNLSRAMRHLDCCVAILDI